MNRISDRSERIEIRVAGVFGKENTPMSRSEAKLLLDGFERYRTIVLDFAGVKRIGPGFADEVFRVFRIAHPGTEIVSIGARRDVEAMIKRVPAP